MYGDYVLLYTTVCNSEGGRTPYQFLYLLNASVIDSDSNRGVFAHSHGLLGLEVRLLAAISRAPFSCAPRTGKTIASDHIGVNSSLGVILPFRERLLHLSFRTTGQ